LADTDAASLTVTDSGEGVSADILSQVFEFFST